MQQSTCQTIFHCSWGPNALQASPGSCFARSFFNFPYLLRRCGKLCIDFKQLAAAASEQHELTTPRWVPTECRFRRQYIGFQLWGRRVEFRLRIRLRIGCGFRIGFRVWIRRRLNSGRLCGEEALDSRSRLHTGCRF